MATTITNAAVDTLIGTEVAPLTRITDVSALPVQESDIQLEFEIDDTLAHVWMSYDELSITGVWTKKVEQANGFTAILTNIQTVCSDVDTAITALTPPFTYADYVAIYAQLKPLTQIRGF